MRARRAVAAVAKIVGLGAVFTLAVAGGAVLSLRLSTPRRFVTTYVNQALASSFKGRVELDRVGWIGLSSIGGVDARVFDPEGHRVLDLRGARVRVSPWDTVRSLLGRGGLVVRLPEVDIDGAEAVVEQDAAGQIGLIRAFEPRTAPVTEQPSTTTIDIGHIHLGHAWVHGHLSAVPVLDADLDDFSGSFSKAPDKTDLGVDHLGVRARGMPGRDPDGTISARVALPSRGEADRHVKARYDGRVGDFPVHASASLDGTDATASVEATIGAGTVAVEGTATLPEGSRTETTADASLVVNDLDTSALDPRAPPSKLSAVIDASVSAQPGGKLTGSFDVESKTGEVRGQLVPAARARGDFTERSVRGTARIAERGAPTRVQFSLRPRAGATSPDQLDVEIESTVADLAQVKRAGDLGHGQVHLVAGGHVDLTAKQLAAHARAEVNGIDAKGVQLARGALVAAASGPLDAPNLDVAVHGGGLRAGGYAFSAVDVRARGPARDLDVGADLTGDEHSPTVSAQARVTYREALAVRDTSVQVARQGVQGTLKVASIRVARGTVDVEGARVEGLGDPIEASARISDAGVAVKARSAGVDLARVAKLAAREEDARGRVALDVDAVASRRGAEGRVDLRGSDLSLRGVEGASIVVSTEVRGTHVRGDMHASLGNAGKIDLAANDVELAGAATEASSWKRATGGVAIDGAVDLAKLLARLPAASRPVETARGEVTIHGQASRSSSGAGPALDLRASTSGLAVITPSWRTEGLDGTVALQLAGSTGHTQVSAELHDVHGELASVDANATLPVARLLEHPGGLAAVARDLPVEATIDVPRRSLDDLPPAIRKLPLQGDIELSAQIAGTARAPRIAVNAKGTKLAARNTARCSEPMDVEATVAYDGERADVRLAAERDGQEVMDGGAIVRVSAARALAGGPLAWEASAEIDLSHFPIEAVSAVAGQPITGELSGEVSVADLHRAAGLQADLNVRKMTIESVSFPRGEVRVTMKEGAFLASARLDQADGSLAAQAKGAMSWGEALAPSLDLARPVDVSVRAENFRAVAAEPFVQGVLNELDGRIDTDTKIHVEPGGKDGTMSGSVTIRDGVFELPQIGERFHAVKGRLIMKPWGTLRLEDISAEAPTGKLEASAVAVLRGFSLARADARVHVAKGESIPITVEGVPFGRAHGEVATHAWMSEDGKRLDLQVDVPTLHVDLPQASRHAVQDLKPDPSIRVGTVSDRGFVPILLAPPEKPRASSDLAIFAAIKLGEVSLKRDNTIEVVVTGQPLIEVTDRTRVRGQLRVVRGRIELQGKQFSIDHGEVSFVGKDPSDPMVVATAYWDGPEGTRVFADFDGHVSSGRLRLRSEPALSQDQILALILFGSPEGSFGAETPASKQESVGARAAGMAGGVVAQGVNKAISGITSADITTRVDTSQSSNPRPELDVQLTKSISARLGYKLGVPAPGENPDRTELTIDWRFIRNWSLTAVVGDQGSTSVDLVWRLRY